MREKKNREFKHAVFYLTVYCVKFFETMTGTSLAFVFLQLIPINFLHEVSEIE